MIQWLGLSLQRYVPHDNDYIRLAHVRTDFKESIVSSVFHHSLSTNKYYIRTNFTIDIDSLNVRSTEKGTSIFTLSGDELLWIICSLWQHCRWQVFVVSVIQHKHLSGPLIFKRLLKHLVFKFANPFWVDYTQCSYKISTAFVFQNPQSQCPTASGVCPEFFVTAICTLNTSGEGRKASTDSSCCE